MKTALLLIGESLRYNDILVEYIKRESLKYLKKIDILYLIDGSDKNLFLILEEVIQKSSKVIISSDDKNFNIIGKILSTIQSDSLVLKNEMLLPSKALLFDNDTYLLEVEKCKVNVLKVKDEQKLPNILIERKNDIKFINIFDLDDESCKILIEPVAENYEIKTKIIKIIEGWNLIKIESLKYGQINNFIESAMQLFKGKIIPQKDVMEHIVQKLIEKDIKLTTAESCTGGLLSSKIIEHSGVSTIINGNLVTYANETKEAWLGVKPETLQSYGAVSEQCVSEMLEGALNVSNADISIAISGVAGPDGGSVEKPVGTVFVGAKSKGKGEMIERLHLKGDRIYIQNQAVYYAIKLLLNLEKDIFF